MKKLVLSLLPVFLFLITDSSATQATSSKNQHTKRAQRVILFIWDGLRPDSLSKEHTPNLLRLKQEGSWFSDNHSSYPTFTMMNAASFATGDFAGKTGFYGNTLWDPRANGEDANGKAVDFKAPVFTEDYKVLQNIDQPEINDPLLYVPTLFNQAHQAQLKTATVGKSGAAFMQNYKQNAGLDGLILDEKHVYPLQYAQELQDQAFAIPKESRHAFKQLHHALQASSQDPTKFDHVKTLNAISGGALGLDDDFMYYDNVTPDPASTKISPYSHSNEYLMQTYLDEVLTDHAPQLSVIWLRNPDTTEHNYGVGSASYYTALEDQDRLLGKLLRKLKSLKMTKTTDLIIASDHGHSNVAGPTTQFPLRLLHHGMVSVPDSKGFAASGDFRPADLLSRAGFNAYDGQGCQYDPVLSGIKKDGNLVYPIRVDRSGAICGQQAASHNDDPPHKQTARLFTTPAYKIPESLPSDGIIVAGNGGSTYFYVPSHSSKLVTKLSRFLQGRQEFGAIFVDDRYHAIPGTLPMSLVHIRNKQGRNPDIIAGSSFDEKTQIQGMPGIEFNSSGIVRGMHGSFSHIDVHNTLLAIGPDFKKHFVDPLPSGNVDVAPTIAHLLNIPLPNTDGRPLVEALNHGKKLEDFSVVKVEISPQQPATHIHYFLATSPSGHDIDSTKTNYTFKVKSKLLLFDGKQYQYFDSAKARRY